MAPVENHCSRFIFLGNETWGFHWHVVTGLKHGGATRAPSRRGVAICVSLRPPLPSRWLDTSVATAAQWLVGQEVGVQY